jgi:hypothetical protein
MQAQSVENLTGRIAALHSGLSRLAGRSERQAHPGPPADGLNSGCHAGGGLLESEICIQLRTIATSLERKCDELRREHPIQASMLSAVFQRMIEGIRLFDSGCNYSLRSATSSGVGLTIALKRIATG